MKYFYIICIALSSFFAYNSISAPLHSTQYAFFIPDNALRSQNQLNDLTRMRPRRVSKVRTSEKKQSISQSSDIFDKDDLTSQNTKDSSPKFKRHFPYQTPEIKEISTIQKEYNLPNDEEIKPQEEIQLSPELERKMKEFKLDDITDTKKNIKSSTKEKSYFEQLINMDTEQLFKKVKYDDSHLPHFKQLYNNYCSELKMLDQIGELPKNHEQEDILKKSNSMLRFKVK